MCSIIGALVWNLDTSERVDKANEIANYIVKKSHERGRDGRGFLINSTSKEEYYLIERDVSRMTSEDWEYKIFFKECIKASLMSNLRAEPTTEYVKDKREEDQQPYVSNGWGIVHNGTIANDRALRNYSLPTKIDSAAIAEILGDGTFKEEKSFEYFVKNIQKLKGSYAILANHFEQPGHLMIAVNYRPAWYIQTEVGVFFASSRSYLPSGYVPRMVTPYSVMSFNYQDGELLVEEKSLRDTLTNKKALVVCSGGLDSVVAATFAKRRLGYEIELIHFLYGCRAEGHEVEAIRSVAEELGVKHTLFPLNIYEKGDSPLLDADSKFAGGEEGAEFAHEWVPARNLVMLSVATAYAEAKGFDTIVLGNNLEEAGAYPDNEPEFIDKFNDLLPFAVADGKRMNVIMPVGNLMKHEIVALGHEVNAPLHLTWSCYRAGEKHCGTCGPCYMRKTAFEINGLPEVIDYEK